MFLQQQQGPTLEKPLTRNNKALCVVETFLFFHDRKFFAYLDMLKTPYSQGLQWSNLTLLII